MKLILLGAPGSGKGTQGTLISQRYGIAHVSSGEILRQHVADDTDTGRQIKDVMARGELIADELLLDIMRTAVFEAVESGGYILDGVPRTLEQALVAYEIGLLHGITADLVLHLTVPDEAVIDRLSARAHAEGRADDADRSVVERRLAVYHDQTQPLLDFYESRGLLRSIDAARGIDEVSASLWELLDPLV